MLSGFCCKGTRYCYITTCISRQLGESRVYTPLTRSACWSYAADILIEGFVLLISLYLSALFAVGFKEWRLVPRTGIKPQPIVLT
jgi:hypothetical protein